jgi:hypothetical protein
MMPPVSQQVPAPNKKVAHQLDIMSLVNISLNSYFIQPKAVLPSLSAACENESQRPHHKPSRQQQDSSSRIWPILSLSTCFARQGQQPVIFPTVSSITCHIGALTLSSHFYLCLKPRL